MHIEAAFEPVWRCTWGTESSELRVALGRCDWVGWDTHLEHMINWNSICTWMSWWYKLRGYNQVSMEMFSQAVIEQSRRDTWTLWTNKFEDAHRVHDHGSLIRNLMLLWTEIEYALKYLDQATLATSRRPWLNMFHDALPVYSPVQLIIHWDAEMQYVWRYTSRP